MFRTQLHSAWLALNLALIIATLTALTVGSFWIINDSDAEREQQAQQTQRVVNEALDLSRNNVKTLTSLLSTLPISTVFTNLEIHGKSGRLLQIHYDSPSPGPLEPLFGAAAPLKLTLNEKRGLELHLLPAPGFAVNRLIAALPAALITAAFAFLVVNLTAWLFRQQFKMGRIEESRWSVAMTTDIPEREGVSQTSVPSEDVLDWLPDAILRCDIQGRITYLNAAAYSLLKPQVAGTNQSGVLDLIAPWDRSRCTELLTKTYLPGGYERLESQAVGTSRGIMPVTITFAACGNDELILTVSDASASRAQWEMLQLHNLLLDSIPQGLAVLSAPDNGELLYANPAFRRLLNLRDTSADSWLDRLTSRISPAILAQIRSAIERMTEASLDIPWQATGDTSRNLELRIFPGNSDESRLICTIHDRSEEAHYRQTIERDISINRMILDEMPIGLCVADDRANIRVVNACFAKLMDKTPQQLVGTSISTCITDRSATQGTVYQGEHAIQAAPQPRFARLNTLPLRGANGTQEYAYFFEDITAYKLQALADGNEMDRLQQTLDSISDGIITTNQDGFVQYINPYAQKLTGLVEHRYKGMPFGQVIQLIDEKKREPLVDPVIRAIRIGKTVKFRQDVLFIKENKQDLAVEISATPVYDRKNTVIGAVVVMKDVAEQRSLSQQMQQRASRDPLTGLINRRELLSLLEGLQYEVEEQSKQHTLCYMDLDKFKVVNDSCGHNAGDELLRQVSHLMNECLRASDLLARIGGDEFCAVLQNTGAENGSIVAEKIREAVKRFRFTWDDKFFEIGVSIGLFTLQPGLNIEETISAADQACYQAKELGRDRIYIASSAERGDEKSAPTPWSERLAEALDHDYFRLFRLDAQAIQASTKESPAYHEVILQLHEPNHPSLIASAFMPNAHRLNLASSIERWVIGKLFSTVGAGTPDQRTPDVFAIQLSAATLADSGFGPYLREQSTRHGVSPQRICFEIAEDDLVQNFSMVQHFMLESKKAGYGFCLSRFGGGISSFAYLRNLPLDFLKIDSSLTHRLDSDPIDTVIVRAIQTIGEHMHIRVISHHTDDQGLRDRLIELGVDYIQGPSTESVPLEPIIEV